MSEELRGCLSVAVGFFRSVREKPWFNGVAIALTIFAFVALIATLAWYWLLRPFFGGSPSAISYSQYSSVSIGEFRSVIEGNFGHPAGGAFIPPDPPSGPIGTTCIYYEDNNSTPQDQPYYQFCFDGSGRLVFKDGYVGNIPMTGAS
jgi:hypothetical protein